MVAKGLLLVPMFVSSPFVATNHMLVAPALTAEKISNPMRMHETRLGERERMCDVGEWSTTIDPEKIASSGDELRC